jgi:hypothetical protein
MKEPKATHELVEELWARHGHLIDPEAANKRMKAPPNFATMVRVMDDLVRERVFESFERVGVNRWSKNRKEEISKRGTS